MTTDPNTLDGLDAGRRDRANCGTYDDVAWYTRIAFDHQTASTDSGEVRYFTGYLHAIQGGQ